MDVKVEKWLRKIAATAESRSGIDIEALFIRCVGAIVSDLMKLRTSEASRSRSHLVIDLDLEATSQTLSHIADWLAASVAADVKWLKNVNEAGTPKKFSKFHNLGQVADEADRGMLRLIRQAAGKGNPNGDEKVIATLENGYTVVSLETPEALDLESATMQHCVGLGGYDRGVKEGAIRILSLRDTQGKPHVTMELSVADMRLDQIKGKQNVFPLGRYFDMLVPWINSNGLKVDPSQLGGGYFVLDDGTVEHISTLSEGMTIGGNLHLRGYEGAVVEIPRKTRVIGDVVIDMGHLADGVVKFSEDISVMGNLRCIGAKVIGIENVTANEITVNDGDMTAVAYGARFHSNLVLVETVLGDMLSKAIFEKNLEISLDEVSIPKNICVQGDMILRGDRAFTIADGAGFVGSLVVKSVFKPVHVRIGTDVSIGQNLLAQGCRLSLGDRLKVEGFCMLMQVKLDEVPRYLDVGDLMLNGVSGIKAFPETATIRGDASIISCDLETIGGNVMWPGDLRMTKTQVEALPFRLHVGGTLEISDNPIVSMPTELTVGGNLVARRCRKIVIPTGADIGGNVDLSENDRVSLPSGLVVHGNLNLSSTRLTGIPSGLVVEGELNLARFPVDRIASFATARSYGLKDAFVIDISDLDAIEGDLSINATDIGKMPKHISIGGMLLVSGIDYHTRLPDDIEVGGRLHVDYVEMLDIIPTSTIRI